MASRGSTKSSRAGTGARQQIVEMLKDDHKRAKKAFRDFEKMDPLEDPEAVRELVERTCAELEVHAELEEQLVYPAARESLREGALVDEAEVEHMTFKMLLEQLRSLDPSDEKYAATFKVLGEYVKHHVKEEEGEMFEQLGGGADWEAVRDQLLERRETLMADKGLVTE